MPKRTIYWRVQGAISVEILPQVGFVNPIEGSTQVDVPVVPTVFSLIARDALGQKKTAQFVMNPDGTSGHVFPPLQPPSQNTLHLSSTSATVTGSVGEVVHIGLAYLDGDWKHPCAVLHSSGVQVPAYLIPKISTINPSRQQLHITAVAQEQVHGQSAYTIQSADGNSALFVINWNIEALAPPVPQCSANPASITFHGTTDDTLTVTSTIAGLTEPVRHDLTSGATPSGVNVTLQKQADKHIFQVKGRIASPLSSSATYAITGANGCTAGVRVVFDVEQATPNTCTLTPLVTSIESEVKPLDVKLANLSGYEEPITVSIASGTSPSGLPLPTVESNALFLKGTPASGFTGTVSYRVTSKDRCTRTLPIYFKLGNTCAAAQDVLSVTGTVGQPLQEKTVALTGFAKPITYSVVTGQHPSGIDPNVVQGDNFVIRGTPNTAGASTVTYALKGTDTCTALITVAYNIAQAQQNCTLSSTLLQVQGSATGVSLQSTPPAIDLTGFIEPVTLTKDSGDALPQGLSLSVENRQIVLKGTTTQPKTGVQTVKVAGKDGCSQLLVVQFRTYNCALSANSVQHNAHVGVFSESVLQVSGFNEPVTFNTSSGSLPDGVQVSYHDNKIKVSGTPLQEANGNAVINVSGKDGCTQSFTVTYNITQQPCAFTPDNLTYTGEVDKPMTELTATASGFNAESSFLESGSLPQGVSVSFAGSPLKIKFAGTPTQEGTFSYVRTVTGDTGCTVSIAANFEITEPQAPALTATLSAPQDQQLKSSKTLEWKITPTGSPTEKRRAYVALLFPQEILQGAVLNVSYGADSSGPATVAYDASLPGFAFQCDIKSAATLSLTAKPFPGIHVATLSVVDKSGTDISAPINTTLECD